MSTAIEQAARWVGEQAWGAVAKELEYWLKENAMNCPKCNNELVMSHAMGKEFEYCRTCKKELADLIPTMMTPKVHDNSYEKELGDLYDQVMSAALITHELAYKFPKTCDPYLHWYSSMLANVLNPGDEIPCLCGSYRLEITRIPGMYPDSEGRRSTP